MWHRVVYSISTMPNKCVFVIDLTLPVGLIANTCAILSLSLGRLHPELIGHDVVDADGDIHAGITTIVMPVLGATSDQINNIRQKVRALAIEALRLIDVTDVAQQTKTYDDYVDRIGRTHGQQLRYLGLCLYGPIESVKSITGSLPSLGKKVLV